MKPSRFQFVVVPLLLVGLACDRRPPAAPGATNPSSTGSGSTPVHNGPVTTYDLLERVYQPLTHADDPLGFAMKIRNLSTNTYRFWRGAKEPFYEWCKTNIADWMGDKNAFLQIHGDLHPGNFGLYLAKGKFGKHVAFGAVDFDDCANLPLQVELLQGVITFRLMARHRSMALTEDQFNQVITEMVNAYKSTLDNPLSPTEMLEDDRWVGKLLKDARKRDYSDEISKYIDQNQFASTIKDKSGRTREILRSIKGRTEFADTIELGLTNSPDGRDLFKEADIRKKDVHDIAQRNQMQSAGSEGLRKYLLLVANKKIQEKAIIFYLKEQVASPAERVGLIPKVTMPAGQRSSNDMQKMCVPPVYFNSWCNKDGASYRLTIKEPWSETMDDDDIRTFADVLHMAQIWGTVAGSMHRGQLPIAEIKARLTPELNGLLSKRSADYSKIAATEFARFESDARTRKMISKAESSLRDLEAGK